MTLLDQIEGELAFARLGFCSPKKQLRLLQALKVLVEAIRPTAEYANEIDGNPASAPYGNLTPVGLHPERKSGGLTFGDMRHSAKALATVEAMSEGEK